MGRREGRIEFVPAACRFAFRVYMKICAAHNLLSEALLEPSLKVLGQIDKGRLQLFLFLGHKKGSSFVPLG